MFHESSFDFFLPLPVLRSYCMDLLLNPTWKTGEREKRREKKKE